MPDLVIPNVHVAGTLAEADDVNGNMDAIESWVNTNTIRADGTVALTAPLTGPATDGASANSLTRKGYVDQFGKVSSQTLTADSGAFGASADTDMQLLNVPAISGVEYALHLHSGWLLVPGGSFCEWNINLKVNGVVTDHFGKANQYVLSTQAFGEVDGTVYWTAPSTGNFNFVVAVEEVSGSYSLTFKGAPTVKRTFRIRRS